MPQPLGGVPPTREPSTPCRAFSSAVRGCHRTRREWPGRERNGCSRQPFSWKRSGTKPLKAETFERHRRSLMNMSSTSETSACHVLVDPASPPPACTVRGTVSGWHHALRECQLCHGAYCWKCRRGDWLLNPCVSAPCEIEVAVASVGQSCCAFADCACQRSERRVCMLHVSACP